MDGDKKKRKMVDADQDENEEDKMDKFFALIKNTREVRERMVAAGENRGKASGGEDKPQAAAGAWNPTFRLEDFMEAPPPGPPPATERAAEAGPSMEGDKQEIDEKKSGDKGLDLNLSL